MPAISTRWCSTASGPLDRQEHAAALARGSGERRLADINALVEESLNLAYHGARAEKQGFNVTIERSLDPSAGEVDVLPQEITRVFLNLISNGFYAAAKRKERATAPYEPTLFAATTEPRRSRRDPDTRQRHGHTSRGEGEDVRSLLHDEARRRRDGLGLSLSHDIVVKQHRGTIEVDTSPASTPSSGLSFRARPPRRRMMR